MAGEAELGTEIPGEESGHDASPVRVEEAVQNKAQGLGWRPLDQWKGDPADWVDAKEFLGRQSLFDKIKSLKDELNNTRRGNERDMADIKAYIQNMSKIEYNRAMKDLKAQRKEAIEDRDVEAVEKIDEQINEIEQTRVAAPSANTAAKVQEVQNKFNEWRSKATWYDEDQELHAEADLIGSAYGMKNPNKDITQICEYVEKTIKKMYPEKFTSGEEEPVEKPVRKAPAVEGGRMSASTPAKGKSDTLTEADLDPQQRQVMNTMIRRGVVSREQFLAQMSDSLKGIHKDFSEYQPKKDSK